jgi:hypothetical protein
MKSYRRARICFLLSAARVLRMLFLALAFAGAALGPGMAYGDAPQSYMGQSEQTAQSILQQKLGLNLVAFTNKMYMLGVLVMLLAGVVGAILWAVGHRGIIINLVCAVVLVGLIVLVILLAASSSPTGA